MKINYRILALFLFIILSWGIAWPINKIGLDYMSPVWYTAIRLIIGTATMFALVIALKKFSFPQLRDMPLIITIGFLQISLYILLANLGLAYIPAGRAAILAYTTPLWIMPIATFFFKEEARFFRWLGFILGICGIIVLLSPWEMNWSDPKVIFGSSMLLLASLCWAISILGARYMKWDKSPLELMPWQLLIGTIPLVLSAWIKEPSLVIQWSPELLLSLIYTGVLVTGLSYWCGLIVNRELPSTVVSLGFLGAPVCSLMCSALFLHEAITLHTASAMVLILMGLVCLVV